MLLTRRKRKRCEGMLRKYIEVCGIALTMFLDYLLRAYNAFHQWFCFSYFELFQLRLGNNELPFVNSTPDCGKLQHNFRNFSPEMSKEHSKKQKLDTHSTGQSSFAQCSSPKRFRIFYKII